MTHRPHKNVCKERLSTTELLEDRVLFSVDAINGLLPGLYIQEIPDSDSSMLDDDFISLLSDGNKGLHYDYVPSEQNDISTQGIDTLLLAADNRSSDAVIASIDMERIVFVDHAVPDIETLIQPLLSDTTAVFILQADSDAVQTISDVLSVYSSLDSIQIISHGSAGSLQLGSTAINEQYLRDHQNEIEKWSDALNEGADILLLGCDVANGSAGRAFVDTLAEMTDADVAASTNLTGSENLGGDWQLEYASGAVTDSAMLLAFDDVSWEHTLLEITVDLFSDGFDISTGTTLSQLLNDQLNDGHQVTLREAVYASQQETGEDTIFLPAGGTYSLSGRPASDNTGIEGDLDFSDDTIVTGLGTTQVTILNEHPNRRVLDVRDASLTLNNLNITGGQTTDIGGGIRGVAGTTITLIKTAVVGNSAGSNGGGIATLGSLIIQDGSLVDNNTTTNAIGGGIYSEGAVSISDSEITGNTAKQQGGGIYSTGSLSITQSTVSDNETTDLKGGGIYSIGALSIANTIVSNNISKDDGGGIFTSGNATISNDSLIDNNTTTDSRGGGIYAEGALTISSSIVSSNIAWSDGGGVYSLVAYDISGSTFQGNISTGHHGGGVYGVGTGTVTDVNFIANSVTLDGGAIYAEGDLDLSSSYFEANEADRDGGALFATEITGISDTGFKINKAFQSGGAVFGKNSLNVLRSSFLENKANSDRGGAIYSEGSGELTVYNASFIANTAKSGGAIVSQRDTSVVHSTFVDNTAAQNASAIWLETAGGSSAPQGEVSGSLFARNLMNGGTSNVVSGALISLGFNLFDYNEPVAIQVDLNDVANPVLDVLNEVSGSVSAYTLAPGSPAINAGIVEPSGTTDSQGNPRDEISDIGASEADSHASVVFWGDANDNLYRSNISFTNIQKIASTATEVVSVAVDKAEQRVYWLNAAGGVLWTSLDGSAGEQTFLSGLSAARSISIDAAASHLYVSFAGLTPRVERYSMAGTNQATVVSGLLDDISDIEVNSTANRLFWVEQGLTGSTINSQPLMGNTASTVIYQAQNIVTVTSNDNGSYVYWTEGSNGFIGRLDGNGVAYGVTPDAIASADSISYDTSSDSLVWSSDNATSISVVHADLDTAVNSFVLTDTVNDLVTMPTSSFNRAPVLSTIEAIDLSHTENDGTVQISSTLTLSDADDINLESATVVISGNYGNGEDVLGFTNQSGISGVWNNTTGLLTLTGSATVADYQAALRSVTYQNTSENPSTLVRTITFNVNDGDSSGNALTRDIVITAANDAPVLSTIEGDSLAYTENDGAAEITSTLTLSDVDDINLESATVAISGNYSNSEDVLEFNTQNGISGVWNNTTGVLTLSGSATVADYQSALRSVTYQNTSEDPSTLARTITFNVNDGDGSGNALTRDIVITAVNDAPVLSAMEGGGLAYTENDGAAEITSTLTLSDVDDSNLESATVVISGNYSDSEDALGFTNQNGISGVWDHTTGVLTLSGSATVADYQSALRSVTYQNTSEDPTILARTITFNVNDGDSSGNALIREIVITAVNDAPEQIINNMELIDLAYTENDGAVGIFSTLLMSDADDINLESATVAISGNYRNGEDVLEFNTQNGISGVWNNTTGVLTLTGSATVADYQAALRSVKYQNTSEDPSTLVRTITFNVNDGESSGNALTRDIVITAANDAPVLSAIEGIDLAYTENDGAVALSSTLTLSDVDDVNLEEAVIVYSGQYRSGEDVLGFIDQNGITGMLIVTSNGVELSLRGSASVADYQTALRSVTYLNTSENPSSLNRSVSIAIHDGDSISNFLTRDIVLSAANDAPVLSAIEGSGLAYTENDGAAEITSTLTLSDADDINLESATVAISGNYRNGEDVLEFNNQNGIIGVWDNTTGVLTLSGSATVADYQAALRSVKYQNTSEDPSTLVRTITFNVNDGDSPGNALTRDIVLSAVNDAPVLSAMEGGDLAYTENDGAAEITSTLMLSDVDDSNLESATVVISGNYRNGEDVLEFNTQNGISGVWDNTTGVLTLTGSATVADYQVALRSVTYQNTSEDPSTLARTITFNVNDGDSSGNALTRDIVLSAVNDAPVLSAMEGGDLAYTENDGAAEITSTLMLSDVDDSNLESATVVISGNYRNGEDALGFTNQNGISGVWDNTTGVLTLTGSATVADYQSALRSVTYQNTSEDPSTLARTITFNVNDGDSPGNALTRDIVLSAANDAPVLSAMETIDLAYTENDGAVALSSTLTLSDADDIDLVGATIVINGGYSEGEDVLSFADQNGISGTWNGATGSLTLSGTASVANYQTALRSVAYQNTSEDPSTLLRALTFNVNDGSSDGNGIARNVTVSAVNDAPLLTIDASVAIKEGDYHVLTINDLLAQDEEDAREDLVYRYTAGPMAGSITVETSTGPQPLSVGAVFTHQQLLAGTVRYNHDGFEPVVNPDVVTFVVTDTEGLDSSDVTLSFDIQPVNDLPYFTLDNTTVPENEAGARVGIISSADEDQGDIVTISIDDQRFTTVGSELSLKEGLELDFETEPEILVEITAKDLSGATVTQQVLLSVLDVNDPPETLVSPEADMGDGYQLPGNTFVDSDGDKLSIRATLENGDALPVWLEFDANTLKFEVTEPLRVFPELQVLVIAEDGRGGSTTVSLVLQFDPILAAAEPVISETVALPEKSLPDAPAEKPSALAKPASAELPVKADSEKTNNTDSPQEIAETVDLHTLLPPLPKFGSLELAQVDNRLDDSIDSYSLESEVIDVDVFDLSQLLTMSQSDFASTTTTLMNAFNADQENKPVDVVLSKAVSGGSAGIASGLSVGYLLWLIRGGTLMGSMLSALPAWRFVDPLPVLGTLNEDIDDDDDESLASMVDTKDDTEAATVDPMPLEDVKMTHESNATLGKMIGKRS